MKQAENNSAPTVSYLLEHSHGTCELWLKSNQASEITIYEPLKLLRVSGRGTVLLKTEMIAEAIQLENWMANHLDVFVEGRTAYD